MSNDELFERISNGIRNVASFLMNESDVNFDRNYLVRNGNHVQLNDNTSIYIGNNSFSLDNKVYTLTSTHYLVIKTPIVEVTIVDSGIYEIEYDRELMARGYQPNEVNLECLFDEIDATIFTDRLFSIEKVMRESRLAKKHER